MARPTARASRHAFMMTDEMPEGGESIWASSRHGWIELGACRSEGITECKVDDK